MEDSSGQRLRRVWLFGSDRFWERHGVVEGVSRRDGIRWGMSIGMWVVLYAIYHSVSAEEKCQGPAARPNPTALPRFICRPWSNTNIMDIQDATIKN